MITMVKKAKAMELDPSCESHPLLTVTGYAMDAV